jgi:hypothetical protein
MGFVRAVRLWADGRTPFSFLVALHGYHAFPVSNFSSLILRRLMHCGMRFAKSRNDVVVDS